MTGAEASTPAPDAPPGRVPFKTTWRKVSVVVANLTAFFVFVRELGALAAEGERTGWGETFAWFLAAVTVKSVLAVIFNCFAVALPIAGVIHYVRYLSRPR